MSATWVTFKSDTARAWFRSCLHRRACASQSLDRTRESRILMGIRERASGEVSHVWLSEYECLLALDACEPRG